MSGEDARFARMRAQLRSLRVQIDDGIEHMQERIQSGDNEQVNLQFFIFECDPKEIASQGLSGAR